MTKYDEQFKLSVVQSPESGTQGYKSIARQDGLQYVMVRRWVAAYRQHGVSGLRKKFSRYSTVQNSSCLCCVGTNVIITHDQRLNIDPLV